MLRRTVFAALTLLASATLALAQQVGDTARDQGLAATIVATGLEHPWAMAFLPDGDLLVTERPGRMRIVGADGTLGAPLKGVPDVYDRGQGGLLDVVLAPDFTTSRMIIFTYSKPMRGGAGTAVATATLDRANGRLSRVTDIFMMNKPTGAGRHFGSRIVVAPDGALFVTLGDRGEMDRAQDRQDHAGKVIRINIDGSVPADNPFADGGALPEIWSIGHRNPQGAALDALTGTYYTISHGARGGDEINAPQAGRNYGWPTITYGRDYSGLKIGVGTEAPGLEQPLFYWDPSIAPSGAAVYRGAMFPAWDGDMLVGALRGQALHRVTKHADGTWRETGRYFADQLGRIRDVREHPDGSIWLLTDDNPGSVIRVTPE